MGDGIDIVFSSWYNEELAALASEHQARIEARIRRLPAKGWMQAVADRTIAPLRDGIYEIRVQGTGPAFRVLFFVMPGRTPRIIILTSCVAKSVMTKRHRMNAELERAKVRRDLWLEQQRKGGTHEGG
jgi:putative component of toxin-antitoxin plasmid stabilization module